MSLSPIVRRALGAVLVLAAAAFLTQRIVSDLDALRGFDWEVRPALLLLSVVLLSGVFLWGVLVWRAVLRRFGVRVPLRPLARAWFLSNLSRYIPGVVWQFLSLAQLGGGAGLNPATTVSSLLVQMGFSLLGAGVVGVWLLPAELAGTLAPAIPVARALSPLAILLVHPAVIRRGAALVTRFAKKQAMPWAGTWADGVWILALGAVSWLFAGATYYLFLLSFVDLPLSALPAATAINALSFIVGYVVVLAPGGLGFKEAAMSLLLAGMVPASVGASLAVAARLWTIAAEVLPALVLVRGRRAAEDGAGAGASAGPPAAPADLPPPGEPMPSGQTPSDHAPDGEAPSGRPPA